jgi:transcriptional regulator with XRE-family HTH domain
VTRTGKAIEALRSKLGDSQYVFAKRLGTTVTTISRYENGHIEPSEEVLLKLAALAESAGEAHLRDTFESQRRAGIVARVESLPSPGTQRRVSLDDLKYIAAVARNVHDDLENTLARIWKEIPNAEDRYPWLTASLQSNALPYLGRVLEETELQIDEPYGPTRQDEDKRLLRRGPSSTYGLQAPQPTKKGKKP